MHLYYLLALVCSLSYVHAYHWPTPEFDYVEDMVFDCNAGPFDLATSCKRDQGNDRSIVAAEWLRLAYHDMSTHNVDDGTGGLDGSIALELARPENVGNGNRFTVTDDFQGHASKYVSRADIYAIGAAYSVFACGGPALDFRVGRKDATELGPPGVPQPFETLETHTEAFRRMGFTPKEMISLVACGHTLGGVRGSAVEYINNSTQNPLVFAHNATFESDGRIFGSDGNTTMKRLASSNDEFITTCKGLLERMLDTVPSNVKLSDPISPILVKPRNVQLTILPNSANLHFQMNLRLLRPLNAEPKTVNILWAHGNGSTCDDCSAPFVQKGDFCGVMPLPKDQTFSVYNFNVSIPSSDSISKFWFEVDGKTEDNGGTGFPIQQNKVLWVPQLSSLTLDDQRVTSHDHLVVAVKNDKLPSRVYAEALDPNTADFIPLSWNIEFKKSTTIPDADGYSFYEGDSTHPVNTFSPDFSFDVHSVVDGEVYTWDFSQTVAIFGGF